MDGGTQWKYTRQCTTTGTQQTYLQWHGQRPRKELKTLIYAANVLCVVLCIVHIYVPRCFIALSQHGHWLSDQQHHLCNCELQQLDDRVKEWIRRWKSVYTPRSKNEHFNESDRTSMIFRFAKTKPISLSHEYCCRLTSICELLVFFYYYFVWYNDSKKQTQNTTTVDRS